MVSDWFKSKSDFIRDKIQKQHHVFFRNTRAILTLFKELKMLKIKDIVEIQTILSSAFS